MPLTKANIRRVPYDRATITGYNRFEGVPSSADYRKSLSAEVHDALWFLCRQWQMGEFEAEDAGTAVYTKLLAQQQQMTHIDAGNKNIFPIDQPYPVPLETLVEKEGRIPDLAFRTEAGTLFKQILIEHNLQSFLADFLSEFKIELLEIARPTSQEGKIMASVRANRKDSHLFDSLKKRTLDGFRIYQKLVDPNNDYENWVNTTLAAAGTAVIGDALLAGKEFLNVFEFFYGTAFQQSNPFWQPEQLNYAFNIQSDQDPGNATILESKNYPGGKLEWFDFDLTQVENSKAQLSTHTYISSPVSFPGMPKSRWWEMEENEINFGNVNVKTTDLLSLILMDFALVYGNDWQIIPFPMQLNSLCNIKGLLVKDVFGFHTYIPPINTSADKSWVNWSLFSQTDQTGKMTERTFYLAPGLLKPIENEPLEKISLLRDEVSNMAWAFENIIPGAMGYGLNAAEVSNKDFKEEPAPTGTSLIKYTLGTEVPFYQIPFVPIEISPGSAQIRLQRAKLPGQDDPKGILLTEIPSPYFVREETISQAGTTVGRRWQRTRWINGLVVQWIGREKESGKGEGASTLLFDQITQNNE